MFPWVSMPVAPLGGVATWGVATAPGVAILGVATGPVGGVGAEAIGVARPAAARAAALAASASDSVAMPGSVRSGLQPLGNAVAPPHRGAPAPHRQRERPANGVSKHRDERDGVCRGVEHPDDSRRAGALCLRLGQRELLSS